MARGGIPSFWYIALLSSRRRKARARAGLFVIRRIYRLALARRNRQAPRMRASGAREMLASLQWIRRRRQARPVLPARRNAPAAYRAWRVGRSRYFCTSVSACFSGCRSEMTMRPPFQRREERRRNELAGSGRDDLVVRRVPGHAVITVATCTRTLSYRGASAAAPTRSELFDDVDRVDLRTELRENRCLSNRRRADLEHAVVRLELEHVGHQPTMYGCEIVFSTDRKAAG